MLWKENCENMPNRKPEPKFDLKPHYPEREKEREKRERKSERKKKERESEEERERTLSSN